MPESRLLFIEAMIGVTAIGGTATERFHFAENVSIGRRFATLSANRSVLCSLEFATPYAIVKGKHGAEPDDLIGVETDREKSSAFFDQIELSQPERGQRVINCAIIAHCHRKVQDKFQMY